jgi:CrcB protein
MSTVIWVALGGAIGSAARYGLAGAVNYRSHPWGTVTVNVLGALVVGLLIGMWGFRADSDMRVGVAVGLLGGFTTFSTFAVDVIHLWEHGQEIEAVLSIAVTMIVGIGAAVVGVALGRSIAG